MITTNNLADLLSDAVDEIEKVCKDQLENLEMWRDVSVSTDSPRPDSIPLRTKDIMPVLAALGNGAT
jgi:hypothetical protein